MRNDIRRISVIEMFVITRFAQYGRLSVRQSVCPVSLQQQRRLAGLLLSSGAGSKYRSIAAAVPRHIRSRKFWSDCKEVQHTCYNYHAEFEDTRRTQVREEKQAVLP